MHETISSKAVGKDDMLVDHLWRHQPGKYFCLSTKDPQTGDWGDHFFPREDITDVASFIRGHKDQNLYFCPHGFSKPRRRKQFAVLPNLLWADLDERDPREVPIEPTVAWESSPGRYAALWYTDEPVTEELNCDLAYHIGSDRSGWDLTQVLRIPETINYKYPEKPRGKLLWDDGDTYQRATLARTIPHANGHAVNGHSDIGLLYRKYEKLLPPDIRRELMRGKPVVGKRSDVGWRLLNTMIEKSIPTEDAIELYKHSPWNKFKGRRNEDHQINREIEKIIARRFDEKEVKKSDTLEIRSLDEITEENTEYLYYPFFARGEVTMIDGDPGIQKSFLLMKFSQAIVDGDRLPEQRKGDPVISGPVVYINLEDSPEKTIKRRARILGMKNQKSFLLVDWVFGVDDVEEMDKLTKKMHEIKPVFIVVDPLNYYLGATDMNNISSVSQAIEPFIGWARELNSCVCLIRHWKKSGTDKAIHRATGSIGFVASARISALVAPHPEDPDARVLAVYKSNLNEKGQALGFKITPAFDKRGDPRFKWLDFFDADADKLVGEKHEKTDGLSDEAAISFLEKVLADGELERVKVERMVSARSISVRSLDRAIKALKVKFTYKGFGSKKTVWLKLP